MVFLCGNLAEKFSSSPGRRQEGEQGPSYELEAIFMTSQLRGGSSDFTELVLFSFIPPSLWSSCEMEKWRFFRLGLAEAGNLLCWERKRFVS